MLFGSAPLLMLAMGPVLAFLASLIVFNGVRYIAHRLSQPKPLLP